VPGLLVSRPATRDDGRVGQRSEGHSWRSKRTAHPL
jgi:hypothetical protein